MVEVHYPQKRPGIELGDIFRDYGQGYRQSHRMNQEQVKAMRAIEQCRTAALGGHIDECDECGAMRISYNSCRNRHCPKCQYTEQAEWVAARKQELLPIQYFHVVFTLPSELNSLLPSNARLIYELLFKAASQTLKEFGKNNLGGEIGLTAVLHTWGQNLMLHPHLHCIVTGGVLAGTQWRSCSKNYLFPVKALSKVFSGKYRALLTAAYTKGQLVFMGEASQLADTTRFKAYMTQLSQLKWVVYAKKPFAGPQQVIDYVGRYTHRIAISNHRLLAVDGARVSFRWKDYRDGSKHKVMQLSAEEFIRRFLLHVLPKGFMRIRHYGLLAGSGKEAKLKLCRLLLNSQLIIDQPTDKTIINDEQPICPYCGKGRLVRRLLLPHSVGPPVVQSSLVA